LGILLNHRQRIEINTAKYISPGKGKEKSERTEKDITILSK